MLPSILAAVLTFVLPTDAAAPVTLRSLGADGAEHVIVRGTPDHDDTLVIELPVAARRIDYDGGAGGFDALEIRGGTAITQRYTQLNPHDGIIEIDGLTIHYTNLEPITDIAPAATLVVNGTAGADTVTITNGPGGTTTISSPTFESVTFANKTSVVFDGLGGGDTVDFNNPTPATGLVSFVVRNVATVTQTAAVNYPLFGVQASGNVTLGTFNDVNNLEIAALGNVVFQDIDDFIAGGVDATLPGVSGASVTLSALGTGGITVLEPIVSTTGGVTLRTSRLLITAPVNSAGTVVIETWNLGPNIDLGSVTDVNPTTLELSDAEIDLITAPALSLETFIGVITVSQPITTTVPLILRTPNWVTATGTGALSTPSLTFDIIGGGARTFTITPATFQMTNGTAIPYSGVTTLNLNTSIPGFFPGASTDTFNVAPSPTTTINIDANLPAPPTSPGDTLDFDLTGVTSPVLTATLGPNGYSGSLTSANRQPVNFSDIETIIDAPVDIAATKTDNATSVVAGTTVTYTITVTNPGPLPVAGVGVTDTFPPQLTNVTWTCAPSAGSSCTGAGSGNLNQVVTLGANGSVTYTVTGTLGAATPAGTLTNTVNVTTPAGFVETNPTNNSATDASAITTSADLLVTKSAGAQTVPGANIEYTITLRNAGPSDAQNVTLTDVLPPNTTLVSFTAPAGYACTTPAPGTTGTITCTRPTLPPSATADTFTLVVNVNRSAAPGTTVSNTVTATSTTPDPTPANTASAVVNLFDASIPTLSEWMLMFLAAALAMAAMKITR